jgi:hypothetical protein
VVLDPFGGVALGALDAQRLGLTWIGIELEEKFVKLGNQNIALWNRRFGHVPGWGSARLLQGDSRRLGEVVAGAGLAVSSPPYTAIEVAQKQGDDVYPDGRKKRRAGGKWEGYNRQDPANLGNLPATPRGLSLALSSPPYAETVRDSGDGIDWGKATRGGHKPGMPRYASTAGAADGYGSTPGQLGAMRAGQPPSAVVSSPPYSGYDEHGGRATAAERDRRRLARVAPELSGRFDTCFKGSEEYGVTPGQLGNLSASLEGGEHYGKSSGQLGETAGADFWSASRVILEQVYAVLKPNGHAIFVTKDFIRGGKRVPFSDQWQALCEAVGFRCVCSHRALLVSGEGEQQDAFGQHKKLRRERKSFFRRLAEAKGSPCINHDDVRCFVK